MPVKKVKNTSPARRQMSTLTYEEITSSKPRKQLVKGKKQNAGRNNGTISIRHRGGGSKRRLRDVDFNRASKLNIEGTVKSIEYDPNRSAFIALTCYKDGEYKYHLSAEGMEVGDKVMTAEKTKAKRGNRMHIKNIPIGFEIYNVELKLNRGGQTAKSAGNSAKLVSLDGEYAQVELPSGEVRFVPKECFASIGRVSNIDHNQVVIGKAGRNRWKGKRPTVRGKVMNPCDHPHGGGEGANSIGMAYPKTPWGMPALGVKTRRRKDSNRWIVKTRKGKNLSNLK
ncbi:50S ribosomal protein L2 [Candidatus Peregrinibacteria bacterium]|jgi:large subunit ribosomal protein L2|nr:50S ribosomal protein L2 [Candidatus Peregrinibacteria bacterium]MBT4631624.1 50S ribosomal protein L2 [Candidatus Peregrinibacteria bacterium]MBT5516752.1 50S ribosomal protein L2 [Candidatus Peregrinibacteria bacterium]MBT5823966.1 50S ribosomal protein L2 [Candidatus Peregrinibacteria bacterium]